MSKHFIISKEVVEGKVVSEEGFRFYFYRDDKKILVPQRNVGFTELKAYIDTLQALAWALRDDIEQAISDEQDDSLPDFVGDETDHIK